MIVCCKSVMIRQGLMSDAIPRKYSFSKIQVEQDAFY